MIIIISKFSPAENNSRSTVTIRFQIKQDTSKQIQPIAPLQAITNCPCDLTYTSLAAAVATPPVNPCPCPCPCP